MDATPGKTAEPTKPVESPPKGRAPLRVVRPRTRPGTAADREAPVGGPVRSADTSALPAADWLATTCRLLPGIKAAAVFDTEVAAAARLAAWPDPQGTAREMAPIAASAAARQRCVMSSAHTPGEQTASAAEELIALPLASAGHPRKIVVVRGAFAGDADRRLMVRLLNQCAGWLPVLARPPATGHSGNERPLLEVIAQCLEQQTLRAAAMAVSTHLATHLGCERVSIGLLHGSRLRLEAISRHGDFDERSALSGSITTAMQEAVGQDGAVHYPVPQGGRFRIVRAHESLCQQAGIGSACSIPLSDGSELTGAVTFEHAEAGRFDAATVAYCEAATGFVGPILAARRRAERSPWTVLRDHARDIRERTLGPRHLGWKLLVGSAAAVLLAAAFLHGDYRIKAQAVLRGTVQRVVVAPIDGFIAEAPIRAGDEVEAGQVLASLDQRALQLEQVKWTSERERLRNEFRAAMAALDSIQVTILRSQLDRAEAELKLVEEQLARTQIVAPFTGIVVSGDLTQAVGAPVKQGATLFEVAPLDSYRVMLEVDERDIGEVAVGQEGHLVLAGFPGERLGFVVERVTPVSRVSDGRNFFSVEATLLESPPLLRPGMQGVARLEAGRRRLGWIWTHRAVDWLSLQAWRWLPLS